VKVNAFAVVGVPVIAPVSGARVKPAGNAPLAMLHVMGVSPVAVNVWLYAVPTAPLGNDSVVIAGAPAAAIVTVNCFVSFPLSLAALTVKVNVFAVVGVPVIAPVSGARVKPAGNAPLAILHVMGVSPVAVNVWLYAVPTAPLGTVVVVIAGAVPSPPLLLSVGLLSHPTAVIANTSKIDSIPSKTLFFFI
jgi:hypothetical protein